MCSTCKEGDKIGEDAEKKEQKFTHLTPAILKMANAGAKCDFSKCKYTKTCQTEFELYALEMQPGNVCADKAACSKECQDQVGRCVCRVKRVCELHCRLVGNRHRRLLCGLPAKTLLLD